MGGYGYNATYGGAWGFTSSSGFFTGYAYTPTAYYTPWGWHSGT